jgi:hypothetical protein
MNEHPLHTPLKTIAQTSGTTIPPSNKNDTHLTGKQQTKVLPRCVRWRLCLGLLTKPTHDNTKSIEEILKSIEDLNALKLRCQRSRYDDIETAHYWSSTPTSIADDTTPVGGVDDKNGVQSASSKGLFGFGANKPKSRSSSDSPRSSWNDGDEVACKGSRWSEFYNTREVLNVIEKDLDRLPSDHYTIFHQWRTRIVEKSHRDGGELKRWQQESDEVVDGKDKNCHLKQEKGAESTFQKAETRVKSRAIRNKSWSLGQVQKSTDSVLAMVEDDKRKKEEYAMAAAIQASIKERACRMSQILFVYARCHPEIGYRQGMHEVLSNVLLAFEMDMLEYVNFTERRRGAVGSFFSKGMDTDGCRAGVDLSGNIVVVRLLDPEYILHDAFTLFECIMTSLAHAYDAIPAGDKTAEVMLEEARTKRGEHFPSYCDV